MRSPFAAKLGVVSTGAGLPGRGGATPSNGGSADLSRHTSLRHYGAIRGSEEPDLADPQLWSPVRRPSPDELLLVTCVTSCAAWSSSSTPSPTGSGHVPAVSVWRLAAVLLRFYNGAVLRVQAAVTGEHPRCAMRPPHARGMH